MDADFIAYVGPASLHDGQILRVQGEAETYTVWIESESGRHFAIKFSQVLRTVVDSPVGMMLYALSEMRYKPPYRRFVFGNADSEDTAKLEVIAQEFQVLDNV